MKRYALLLSLFMMISILFSGVQAQFYRQLKGGPKYRKKNVHSGNQIRTTFFNYGFIGRLNSAEDYGGEWPINSGHFYVGDISVMVGAEIELPNGKIIHPVTVADGPRGNNEYNPNDPTDFWGWEPIPGFDNPDTTLVAMSHQKYSWPPFWPDREGDQVDPGWPGAWNGYFGKDQFNADQESYWWMDDNRDKEFVKGFNFYPDSTDSTRGGLALVADVRGLQWSQVLAQNTIFWLYEIKNVGTTDYDKAVFGMIVGTTIGGDGDTNDDNSFFDTNEDITYSWDFDNIGNTGWSPVGYMGYAFLESPGNRLNGIDDDGDGSSGSGKVIDEQVLQSFQPHVVNAGDKVVLIDYFSRDYKRTVIELPDSGVTIRYNNKSFRVEPGDTLVEIPFNNIDDNLNGLIDENVEIPGNGIDDNKNGLVDEENQHLGLKYIDYIDGVGLDNPMIDEGRDDMIDNDGDWNPGLDDVGLDGKPGTGDYGEGDGQPTSGFQPWGPNGEIIDTGLPGEPNIDKTDVDESDQIGLTSFYFFFPFNVVKLYDDEQLWQTLRPGFFNATVQNVDGDFIYGTGYFPLLSQQIERISLAFFFGDDQFELFRTKKTVQEIYNNNYNFALSPKLPVVRAVAGDHKVTLYWDSNAESSYDKFMARVSGNGFDFEGYKIYRATFPTWDETGEVTNAFGNRVSDVPIAQFDVVDSDSGFFPVGNDGVQFYLGNNSGLVHTYTDSTVQNGFTYFYAVTAYDHGFAGTEPGELFFPAETSKFATISASGKVELGQNVVMVRPEAPAAGYVPPVAQKTLKRVSGDATGQIFVEPIDPLKIKDGHTYEISFSDSGAIKTTTGFTVVDITNALNDTIVKNNPNIDVDATVFDGIKLHIMNDWHIRTDQGRVHYSDTQRNLIDPLIWSLFNVGLAKGSPYPANYEIEFGEMGIDTVAGIQVFGLPNAPKIPVDFRIKNTTDGHYIKFNLYDIDPNNPPTGRDPAELQGRLDWDDLLAFFEQDESGKYVLTYGLKMQTFKKDSLAELAQPGDTLYLPVRKPFLHYDKFQFTAIGPKIDPDKAKQDLDLIKVVPNPYVATAIWEPRNNFASGRGERSIHFIHLPQRCTIRIYNIRGELVDVLEHNSPVVDGTEKWDLLSRDNLDVAYGVYIYHIDAPGIGEKIGKFAIIK